MRMKIQNVCKSCATAGRSNVNTLAQAWQQIRRGLCRLNLRIFTSPLPQLVWVDIWPIHLKDSADHLAHVLAPLSLSEPGAQRAGKHILGRFDGRDLEALLRDLAPEVTRAVSRAAEELPASSI
jgi:hypothetical protein